MGDQRRPLDERALRMAIARNLAARLWRFVDNGIDELRVIDAFMLRLELGLERYGALDLEATDRDWQREADEEAVDREIYRCFARVSRRDELPRTQAATAEAGSPDGEVEPWFAHLLTKDADR